MKFILFSAQSRFTSRLIKQIAAFFIYDHTVTANIIESIMLIILK